MATLLTKPVKRETLRLIETHGKHRNKAIIVELLPGDDLSFRVKGTKFSYTIYLGHCLRLAQMQTVEANYRLAMEKYKCRGTKRMRKPQHTSLPFHSQYFKALSK